MHKRSASGFFFGQDCAFGVSKTRGAEGRLAQIYFALPNDTNTISWPTEQIESHSLFLSLTLCLCLFPSVSPFSAHASSHSSHIDYHMHIDMLPYIDVLHSTLEDAV